MKCRAAILTLALAAMPAYGKTELLVPAYFDPSQSTGWNTLISSVSAQVPITAIMNPNSGPVAQVDPSYTSAINSLQAAGGLVVAYVHTSDGSRSISAVEKDIATYQSEYPQINGIFLDEMANTNGKLSYYKSLYTYIKNDNINWEVIGNPGTSTLSTYLAPAPGAADELVTFENDTGYSSYTPSSWQSNYNSSSFANIVYAVPDINTMQSDLSLAISNRAANVYFTDQSGSNPYASLPTYWTQEVAAVRAINGPPLTGTYISASSGDYNSAANWSGAIPNAIDAEAEFMGAISVNHTVYSDLPVVAGKIIFDNLKTYVLAGAGSLTMETTTGNAMIDAQAGVQKITLPITIASPTTLNADEGATLIIAGPLTVNAGQSLTESGTGSIKLQGSLTVQPGGSVSLLAGTSVQSLAVATASRASEIPLGPNTLAALQIRTLSLAAGSSFNLNGQGLIVQEGPLSSITAMVQPADAAIDSGLFDSALTSHLSAVAVISDTDAGLNNFDGSAVTSTDLLIKSATYGDTNLDGTVDAADYAKINAGFSSGLTGWFNGDFNYDGIVNGADYALIDNAYNSQSAITTSQIAGPAAAVPEPSTTGVAVLLLSLLRSRRLPRNRVASDSSAGKHHDSGTAETAAI